MKIIEINFANNETLKDKECINIDCHTIALVDGKDTYLMFKHAINGCEGINAQELEKTGDIRFSQNSHLSKWMNDKSTVTININGNNINCKIHSYTTFSIFLEPAKYINKSRIAYIKGPRI